MWAPSIRLMYVPTFDLGSKLGTALKEDCDVLVLADKYQNKKC